MSKKNTNWWGETLCIPDNKEIPKRVQYKIYNNCTLLPREQWSYRKNHWYYQKCDEKFKLRGKFSWKRDFYIAVRVYQMFLHKAMRYSPFKMLYGREAIWSKKLPHLIYDCNETYHKAVENHIIKIMEIYKVAIIKN